jgi:CheY-like chemotaxis protein
MNVLLIDDEAKNGWQEVIEKVFFNGNSIDIADNKLDAIEKVKNKKFDLIFLDIRFGEEDHKVFDICKMSGYQILTKDIRSTFKSLNFSTPVLAFTASNKVWNIFELLDAGADDYYIKEHPDNASDIDFSKKNFIRLKGDGRKEGVISNLLKLGERRRYILGKINNIDELINKNIKNENIKKRVNEKLKIGYGLLFKNQSTFESDHFIYSNESMAFVVFWSILEEVSKDFFENYWQINGNEEGTMRDNKWKLRKSGKFFIEDLRYTNSNHIKGHVKVSIKWNNDRYEVTDQLLGSNDKNLNFFIGKVNLSTQVYAIMLLDKNWDSNQAKVSFKPLNEYRNEVDFIHSSVSKIFSSKVCDKDSNLKSYEKCKEILEFIIKLLED